MGFRPELFQCVECGQDIIEQDQYISGELGGVVCPGCAGSASGVGLRPITSRVLKYLRHIQRSKIQDLFAINITPDVEDDLEKEWELSVGEESNADDMSGQEPEAAEPDSVPKPGGNVAGNARGQK